MTERLRVDDPAPRVSPEQIDHARRIVAGMATGTDRPAEVADARDLMQMIGLIPPSTQARDLCGTWQGYNRHQQMKEEPCESCRAAFSVRRRQHRKTSTTADGV